LWHQERLWCVAYIPNSTVEIYSLKVQARGGPLSVILAFLFVGIMLWCTIQALGEMAVLFPVAGSFSAYSTVSPIHLYRNYLICSNILYRGFWIQLGDLQWDWYEVYSPE